MTRRDSLRRIGRWFITGVLILFGFRLFRNAKADHVCINRSVCRGCGKFDVCILPAAMSAKRTRSSEEELSNQ